MKPVVLIKREKSTKGFITLEIIISLFIITTVISSLFSVFFGSQYFLSDSETVGELIYRNRLNLEEARALGYRDIETLVSWREQEEHLEEELSVKRFYDFSKEVESRASWNSNFLELSLGLKSFVSDWKQSVGSNTCFRNFKDRSGIEQKGNLDISENLSTDIDVVGERAYITTDSSSGPNFFIVDVSDPLNPVFVSDNFGTGKKISSLHIAGRYAYVSTNSTAKQIQVVDVFDSSNPNLLTEYKLPDPSSTTTPTSIFYKDQKIYLGTGKHDGGLEFHLIDVSQPGTPRHLNSWEIDAKVNDIIIKENFAFLASVNPFPLRIIDLSDYFSEAIKVFVSSPSNDGQAGQNLSLVNNFLILSRSVFIRVPDYDELVVFDISDLPNPIIKDTFRFGETTRGVVGRENLLAVATTWGSENKELQFFRPDESYEIGLPESHNLSEKPVAIDCEDNFIYVVTESPSKLIIFEIL